ncbi:MAG: hypothetical protein RLZZ175_1025 [Bacteroidota bacterium]|jgi:hypothetical protein
MKDWLTCASEFMSIVTGFIAIGAFLGIYKFVDIFKWKKVFQSRKVCKNDNATPLSIRAKDVNSAFDKDFLLLNSKVYWIKNHETLRYIMKYNNKFSDDNSKKKYVSYTDLEKYIREFDINVIYE